MSSSNLVSVIAIPETDYGKTPTIDGTVVAATARFTDESLSGTPTTTESAAVRADRMSGGLVVTGMDVGGDINFELAKDPFFDQFFALGMMSDWQTATAPVAAVALSPDPNDDQQATLTGTGVSAGLAVGDVIRFEDAGNPGDYYYMTVTQVTDADNLVVATTRGQAAIAAGSVIRPAYVDIGTTIHSVTLAKAYRDVLHLATTDEHSQSYAGSIVSGFSVSAQYGNIVTGTFNTMANGYKQESPSLEQQIATAGGTVNPAGTSNPLNASIDVPVVTVEGEATTFCIESFNISLDNGLTPQNCIGSIAPKKYELGTAAISIDASIYLGDQSYDKFMPNKLTQEPISMTFIMSNFEGGYAFVIPAVQLSFPDPASGGGNQPVMINAAGTAKVGPNGASALRIYKL